RGRTPAPSAGKSDRAGGRDLQRDVGRLHAPSQTVMEGVASIRPGANGTKGQALCSVSGGTPASCYMFVTMALFDGRSSRTLRSPSDWTRHVHARGWCPV